MPRKRKEILEEEEADMSPAPKKAARSKSTKSTKTSRYTSQQERAIQEYSQVTRADKSSAAKALKQAGWNVTNAINIFYSSNTQPNPSRSKLSQVFDGYREDPQEMPDEIGFEGVGNLLGDLSINVEDIGALYLFELVQSPQLGRITRDGFIEGFSDAGADSTSKMRNVIANRQAQMPHDRTIFKSVYNHTFTLLIEDRKKAVDLEQAVDFWRLLLSDKGFQWNTDDAPWLDWYIEYVTTKYKRPINKDLWKQTLAFAEASNKDPSLSFWNEESSWPSVIDDFVQWAKDEKKVGSNSGDAMEIE